MSNKFIPSLHPSLPPTDITSMTIEEQHKPSPGDLGPGIDDRRKKKKKKKKKRKKRRRRSY